MRLKYNILWVDDNKETFESLNYHEEIKSYVKELFFVPTLIFCETAEEARNLIDEKTKFDIILSDYNIGDGSTMEKGDDFISYVRGQNVNTEIMFYSAQNQVPKLDVNRITFFSIPKTTEGYPMLLDQIRKLIDLTIEKLQELTVIRGIVMAEVSELDEYMDRLINKYYIYNGTDNKKDAFNKHITKDIKKNIKEKLVSNPENTSTPCKKDCIHIWEKKDSELSKMVANLESSKKAQTINLIIKEINYKYVLSNKNFCDDYNSEIITVRNNLAHCVSKMEDGKEILITRKEDVTFDSDKFKTIRQSIQKYRNLFDEIGKDI